MWDCKVIAKSQCVTPEKGCRKPGFKLLDPLPRTVQARWGACAAERSAMDMAKTPRMVGRVRDGSFMVRAASSDGWYEVARPGSRWECTCPYFEQTGNYCKHIHMVVSLLIPQDPMEGTVSTVLERIPDGMCPKCRIVARKDGWNWNRGGRKQRYRCAGCGLRFSEKFGFEWQTLAPDLVVDVLDMYAGGMSIRAITEHINRRIKDGRGERRKVSHHTIHRIITRYARVLGTFEGSLHPHVSEKWMTDGMMIGTADRKRYLHSIIDGSTRYWISGIVTVHKDTDDVSPMFWDAKRRAGKVPAILVSDKDGTYHKAWEVVFRSRNHLQKITYHDRHIHANGDPNNNMMERFNSRLRARIKTMRGREGDTCMTLLRVYYNHIRSHMGLGGGTTPGMAAGIRIPDQDRWTVLIQHARLHGIR